MTDDTVQKLAMFDQGLAALTDNSVQVSDGTPEDPSVTLLFSGGASLRAEYWRLLRNGLAVLSSFDHNQDYGLGHPVDARADLRKALDGHQVIEARLDKQTGDLLFAFSGRSHLQVFNLTGYQIWEMKFADGFVDWSNFVMSYLYRAAPR